MSCCSGDAEFFSVGHRFGTVELRWEGKEIRDYYKTRYEMAKKSGKQLYFHFNGKPVDYRIIPKLREYELRYGVPVTIDTEPLPGYGYKK